MLVIMEDRNLKQLFKLLFDDEAVWCLDILQVDAAKRRSQVAHTVDEDIDIFRIN